jgi:hypothetical protein
MLNLEILRGRVRNGFRPFTLHLSDGRNFKVNHPEYISVGRNIVSIINEADDIPQYIDPLHIASLEDHSPSPE